MDIMIIRRISFWARFMGIVTMILGIISALGGLFAFVVGAIPGILSAITGYFLFKSGSEAAKYLTTSTEEQLEGILKYFGKFVLIQGILLIIGIIVMILMFLFMGAFVLTGIHQVMSLR